MEKPPLPLFFLPNDAHGQDDNPTLIHTHKKFGHMISGPTSFIVSEIVKRQPLYSG